MSNNITNTGIFLKQSTIKLSCKKEFPVRAGWAHVIHPRTRH